LTDLRRRRGAPPPDTTPHVVARTLEYREAQEHLLRRLGGALVLQWDALPDDLQDLLIDQAAAVEDRDERDVGVHEIEAFVRTVKTAALSKAAPRKT
jgi:hypothetical protein